MSFSRACSCASRSANYKANRANLEGQIRKEDGKKTKKKFMQGLVLATAQRCRGLNNMSRINQNRIYAPYMIVYLVISLPKLPYINRIYLVLANPKHELCTNAAQACKGEERTGIMACENFLVAAQCCRDLYKLKHL